MEASSEHVEALLGTLMQSSIAGEKLLAILQRLFPNELQAALDILARETVTANISEDDGCLEVAFSDQWDRRQCILPVPFCSCHYFSQNVLAESTALVCPHIIAAVLVKEFGECT